MYTCCTSEYFLHILFIHILQCQRILNFIQFQLSYSDRTNNISLIVTVLLCLPMIKASNIWEFLIMFVKTIIICRINLYTILTSALHWQLYLTTGVCVCVLDAEKWNGVVWYNCCRDIIMGEYPILHTIQYTNQIKMFMMLCTIYLAT